MNRVGKNSFGLWLKFWGSTYEPGWKRRRNLIDRNFFRRAQVGARVDADVDVDADADVDVGLHVAHLRPDLGVVVAGRRSGPFLRYRRRRIRNRKWLGDADADDALGSALQSLDEKFISGEKFYIKNLS